MLRTCRNVDQPLWLEGTFLIAQVALVKLGQCFRRRRLAGLTLHLDSTRPCARCNWRDCRQRQRLVVKHREAIRLLVWLAQVPQICLDETCGYRSASILLLCAKATTSTGTSQRPIAEVLVTKQVRFGTRLDVQTQQEKNLLLPSQYWHSFWFRYLLEIEEDC